MSPWLRRCAFCLVLLSLPAVAGPPREDRRTARLRAASIRPDREEAPPPAVEAVAVSALDAGQIDLAGFVGMLIALAATYVYARRQRVSPVRPDTRR